MSWTIWATRWRPVGAAAAAVAAEVAVKTGVSCSQTVPEAGSVTSTRYRDTAWSAQVERNSDVWPHPCTVSSRELGQQLGDGDRALVAGGRVELVADDQHRRRRGRGERAGVARRVVARPGRADARDPGPDATEVAELGVGLLPGRRPGAVGEWVVAVGAGDPGESLDLVHVAGERRVVQADGVAEREQCVADGLRIVVGLEEGEELREVRPDWRAVHRAERVADQEGVVVEERLTARVDDGDRALLAELARQRRVALGRAGRERAAGPARRVAEPEELLEGGLRAGVAAQPGRERERRCRGRPRRPLDRVEDAVDDQGADVVGEQVGVGDAQVRAVGVARVGQLVVAERLAQHVHVSRRVRCRHVVDDRSAPGRAGVDEEEVSVLPLAFLRRRHREGEGREVRTPLAGIPEAAQGPAAIDPTGVEADEIEARPNLVGEEERSCEPYEVDPEPPGPPGFSSSDPMRCAGSEARWRMTAMSIVGPLGCE